MKSPPIALPGINMPTPASVTDPITLCNGLSPNIPDSIPNSIGVSVATSIPKSLAFIFPNCFNPSLVPNFLID